LTAVVQAGQRRFSLDTHASYGEFGERVFFCAPEQRPFCQRVTPFAYEGRAHVEGLVASDGPVLPRRPNRTVMKRLRTADWANAEPASLLDVDGLGPQRLNALVAGGISTICELLAASDDKLWSILESVHGKPKDPQQAAAVLEALRQHRTLRRKSRRCSSP
jgi:hypothetical protein